MPPNTGDGRIFLSGKWTTERESLRYAETGAPLDKSAIGYAALKYSCARSQRRH